jgi:hypothetical protein
MLIPTFWSSLAAFRPSRVFSVRPPQCGVRPRGRATDEITWLNVLLTTCFQRKERAPPELPGRFFKSAC